MSVPSLRPPPPPARGGITPPDDAPTSATDERRVHVLHRGAVLVVEDDAKFARLVVRAFARTGLPTVHAETGDAALRAVQSSAGLCAVVLDVMIPHPDGIEVCHHLHRTVPHLPVVMMSARSGGEQRARARAAGADAFLSKPFPLHHLVQVTFDLIEPRPA